MGTSEFNHDTWKEKERELVFYLKGTNVEQGKHKSISMKSKTIKPGKHQRGNNRGERETKSNKTKSSKQQRGKRRREKCKQQHGADKKTQERKKGLPAKGETEAASSNGGSLAMRRRRAETVFVLGKPFLNK